MRQLPLRTPIPHKNQYPHQHQLSTTSRDNLPKFHVEDHNYLGGGPTYQLGVVITTEDEGENEESEDEDEDVQGNVYYSEDGEEVALCVPISLGICIVLFWKTSKAIKNPRIRQKLKDEYDMVRKKPPSPPLSLPPALQPSLPPAPRPSLTPAQQLSLLPALRTFQAPQRGERR